MDFLQKKILGLLEYWRDTGALHVVYAVATEGLCIGYLYLIGFLTIETLLPTFVTARFSIATFFFFLIIATILLALLGRFLNLSFERNITRHSPLLWLGFLWGTGILAISLIKFPPLLIPILILLFCIVGFLFWNIFSEDQ